MNFFRVFLVGLLLFFSAVSSQNNKEKYELFNNEWCGDENCYDIMGVTSRAERSEIKGIYNNVSRALHPDKNPNQTESDRQQYLKIVRAWEILNDATRREKYDEFLRLKASIDSPRESPALVFILLFAALTFVVLQYKKQRYNTIRKGILDDGRIQRQLLDLFGIDISGRKTKSKKGKKGKKSKSNPTTSSEDEGKEEEDPASLVTNEQINKALKAEGLIVPGWKGVEPDMKIAAKAIPLFFVWSAHEAYFQIRWQIRYTLMKRSYTTDDRAYLCRYTHGYDADAWNKLSEKQRQTMLRRAGPWRKGQKSKKSE